MGRLELEHFYLSNEIWGRRRSEILKALSRAELDELKARNALRAAARERAILQALRERRLEAHRAALERAEEAQLDEANMLRRSR